LSAAISPLTLPPLATSMNGYPPGVKMSPVLTTSDRGK